MILATSKMIVKAERRSELLEAMMGMLEPVRVEKGCLGYSLCEDVENKNGFLLLEEWETQVDIERHIARENQRRLLSLMDLLSEEPVIRYYTVTKTAGMDLIKRVFESPDSL
ncbi:MAG: antibiotic biosynthesis monooxygenase [Nitrospinae bacterium]|nr:antibiotic biosynthesis monooxygenase [Nitrospinota bacterium]